MFGKDTSSPFGEDNYRVLQNGIVQAKTEDRKEALLYIEGRTGKSNLTSAPRGWDIEKISDSGDGLELTF